jgi:hypothetical protein
VVLKRLNPVQSALVDNTSNEFLWSLQRDIDNFQTKYDRYFHLYATIATMNTKKSLLGIINATRSENN